MVGKQVDAQPDCIRGVRGLMERNMMRYFFAINALLRTASATPAIQLKKRLRNWFPAVEYYSRQLHEMDPGAYLEMKRAENVRQQTVH